ncbi:MAG: eukaryotic-like serine/threonine-protein kinase [Actinomycetota bacterium]|nr:eukaryotic-like serine/threonine-protein kinase [Actinomycetota bacterium]
MTRTDTTLVGTLLERRYRVDRLLARGGMSSVYRGVDTRLDRQVAIKIMDPRFADDRSFVERFEREARSAAGLHHPHVVAVHDQGIDTTGGEESTRAFLVMELVDGGTLRDLMNEQGPLDIALALSVAEPVLSALAAAHDAGLVHRDVKPENVLIGRGGTLGAGGVVKVGDFGLVRAIASAGTTNANTILGTVAYIAPEQVTTGMTTARGDVYATGILLYEMLTGQVPYTGDTAISVAYQHVNDNVRAPSELRPGIPPALDELILRATRREPDARPADAGVFLSELNTLRSTLGIPAVTVPVPPPPDGDRVSDVERTMPGLGATTIIAPITASTPPPMQQLPQTGPRPTMALNRGLPGGPPPMSPPVGMPAQGHSPSGPPPAHDEKTDADGRRKKLIALAVAVVLLGVVIGTGAWLFSGNDNGPTTVAVPSLAGQTQAQAGESLRKIKLTPKYPNRVRDNSVPSGQVIRTDPAAGTTVQPGAEITVVLSSGRPTVPDVRPGTKVEDVEQAIKDEQLVPVRSTEPVFSADVPKNAVVDVVPAPGTMVDLNSQVTILLSKGPEPKPMPNVVGKQKDEAFQILRDAGFEPVAAGDDQQGTVTKTDPAAGTTVTTGSKKVNVFMSSTVKVPDVRFKSFDEATQILTDAGFQVDRKGGGRGNGGFDFVLQQSPDPGSDAKKGSKVEIRGVG